MRALAGPAAPHERGEHALNDRAARKQIGDREAERHGALIAVAVQPHEAGARLREQVLARQHRPRAFLAIAGDRGVDDARIDRFRALVVEPEPLDDAGAEVLYDHVGLGDEALTAATSAGFLKSAAKPSLPRLMA